MGNAGNARIPVDHVIAETAAFPLASEASLRLRPTGLDAELSGTTRDLWREAESRLLGSFPAFSVDEAVAVRDLVWFGGRSGMRIGLPEYLRRVAGLYLLKVGDSAVPTLPVSSENAAPEARHSPGRGHVGPGGGCHSHCLRTSCWLPSTLGRFAAASRSSHLRWSRNPPGRELRRNTPAHRGRVRLPLAVGLCPARDRRKRQSPGRLSEPRRGVEGGARSWGSADPSPDRSPCPGFVSRPRALTR